MFQIGTLLRQFVDLDEATGGLRRRSQLTFETSAPIAIFLEDGTALGEPAADLDHIDKEPLAEPTNLGGVFGQNRIGGDGGGRGRCLRLADFAPRNDA